MPELNRRIRDKFDPSRKAYKDFIQNHPDYAPARLAYTSFLHDMGDEDGEFQQLLKGPGARTRRFLQSGTTWRNYYGEFSPVTNALMCYEKAIELDPASNFITTTLAPPFMPLSQGRPRILSHQRATGFQQGGGALPLRPTKLDPINFDARE